jgi:hypothetical protein
MNRIDLFHDYSYILLLLQQQYDDATTSTSTDSDDNDVADDNSDDEQESGDSSEEDDGKDSGDGPSMIPFPFHFPTRKMLFRNEQERYTRLS